jgi:AcrR family transcriptional regulator
VGSPVTISRVQQGEETRRNILRLAVDLASRHGLSSLTIGDLAKELGMSKSGLFAHFGSKEDLQVATIEAAEKMFGQAIINPAHNAPAGLQRLAALIEGYIRYLEESIFSGGCFFSAAAAEFDDRPGRVRDRVAISMQKWNNMIELEIRNGIAGGEIDASVDPSQLSFELEAMTHQANYGRRLMSDPRSFERARHAVEERLSNASTDHGKALLRGAAALNC